MDTSKRPCIEICVSRDIRAPAEVLYDAWLDSARPGGPWHHAREAVVQPRLGGLFYHAVEHRGSIWHHYGRFLRLERPRMIEFTWMSEATQGMDSLVRMAMAQLGGATLVTITHQRLPDDAMGRSHEEGWERILSGLEAALLGSVKAR